MRITSCHIGAFGSLRDRSYTFDAPVVVVQGPNEVGKSSFYHFLQTMLYGIYPTDETKHPYAPRNTERLQGEISVTATDGAVYTVSRRLLSSPLGELGKPDGDVSDLRNHTVPLVSHVPQGVFEAVYALSLYDLTALSERGAWDDIQDRLLGGLSMDFIRSPREVISELEEDASTLWRPDRRGKPASRRVLGRLKELRSEAREAAGRDEEARELNERIAEGNQQLTSLKDERLQLLAEKRRIDRLSPIRDRLRLMDEAMRDAGDTAPLETLPDDPEGDLEAARAGQRDVERRSKGLERRRAELKDVVDAVTAADRELLERDADIASWSKRLTTYLSQVEALGRTEHRVIELRARLRDRAGEILSSSWSDSLSEVIRTIPRAELRQRIDAYAESERRLYEERVRSRAREERRADRPPAIPFAIAAAVLLAAAAGSFALGWTHAAVALALVAAAAGFGAYRSVVQGRKERTTVQAGLLDDLEDARNERRNRVAELLDALPLPSERLDRADPYLANDVADLQQAERDLEEAEERYRLLEKDVEGERRALQAFAARFERVDVGELSQEQPERMIARLEKMLDDAAERERRANEARTELDRMEVAATELEEESDRLAERVDSLERQLRALGEGDVERGLAEVDRRRQAARRARSYEEDLRREVSDLAAARVEIEELERRNVEWSLSDKEMTRLDERLEVLDGEINELTGLQERRKKDLERTLELPTVDAIQSEQALLEEELAELEARRDRLVLLSNVIQTADHRFREEHQPDVLRRAGRFLSTITEGRYERLDYEEGTDTLRVYESETPRGHVVGAPLSQGTRDQIYLAVRLAIVDHLDDGQERLPVFLDEVFVNWDAGRRSSCYDILRAAAERRQLFIFTCHPWMAEELREALPSHVLNLDHDV